ncbi:MAG: branched-chain amino acid ABC transporter permease [Rhodobacteraceae bacterium]|nr:branched-chain amino acid ABC transporter permease [Paracoccaceae bacterium]
MQQLLYLTEVSLNGLTTGVLYALVALGYVLIFKSSGVFNYAQGVMVLFAALTLVGLQRGQVPFAHLWTAVFGTHTYLFGWNLPAVVAIVMTLGVMVLLAILVERLVLKHLINQHPIVLFMATIGLAYFLEGFGDLMWGSDVKRLDIGLPVGISETIESFTAATFGYGVFVDRLDLFAGLVAAALVFALTVWLKHSQLGRTLRAVADDHQAALSVGISLRLVWVLVWSTAGFVALVAGVMWGAKSGVQFSLSLIALKALPVLMLGGFTSIRGAIVGGLIIGVGEKLFDFLMGPIIGGATESWFAYVLALVFLMFRPQGLYGEKIIERV